MSLFAGLECFSDAFTASECSTHNLASGDAYTLHRIIRGVPEGSVDIQPMQAFPMESNLDVMGGRECYFQPPRPLLTLVTVDFRKGCYVGQELTVRAYHTGAIRKRILPVIIHQEEP